MNQAKNFLLQIRKLDRIIENKAAEKARWHEIATAMTAPLGGEKVQSTPKPHKMAMAVEEYVDIEEEIQHCILEAAMARREIIRVIERLPPLDYDILHKIYVQGKTLVDVADRYDKTYSWATTMHGRALKRVETLLKQQT